MKSSSPPVSDHDAFIENLENARVSRSSGIPLYLQTAEAIERALQALTPQSKALLPGEKELCAAIGVSRPTLRQALAHMTKRGLIYTRQGVGTFRAPSALSRPARLSSLYADLETRGMQPTTRVLVVEQVPADEGHARELHIPTGTPLERLERLRLAEGRPIALMSGLVCVHGHQALSAHLLETDGLYNVLRRNYGIELTMGTQRISCRIATRHEEELLDLPRKSPVLIVRRVAFDARGRGIEIGTTVYPGNEWEVEVGLSA